MTGQKDESDKSFEATPHKLQEARKKGEIPRATDLLAAAAYTGLFAALVLTGSHSASVIGTALSVMIGQSSDFAGMFFDAPAPPMGGFLAAVALPAAPIFALPAAAVLAVLFATRGIVFAPAKLQPKLSRISPISNAKNRFGRSGLFEFAKSFAKLVIYSVCLTFFLRGRLDEMVGAIRADPHSVISLLASLCVSFLLVVVLVSGVIGGIDALFQHFEHLRKNRMSRKEVMDETKDAEGDPYMKQERRQRAQAIAGLQMMQDVPQADVVIVNPTHYAVALKWHRIPGQAPVCVAKGLDEVALRIREIAAESAVPIHSDPPTARALHATTEIGAEIAPDHYRAVAAAIRFAEAMRNRARQRG
ncbi:flagellar type III secretion system protein FlhB [Sulfitobacter sp. LCG007]